MYFLTHLLCVHFKLPKVIVHMLFEIFIDDQKLTYSDFNETYLNKFVFTLRFRKNEYCCSRLGTFAPVTKCHYMYLFSVIDPHLIKSINTVYQGRGDYHRHPHVNLKTLPPDTSNWYHSIAIIFPYTPT